MKALVLSAIMFAGISASAKTHIFDNVFTASGFESNYGANVAKLQKEFSKVSSAEMGLLTFAGATVEDDSSVVYNFHRFEKETAKEICWSNLSFTRTVDAEKLPVISGIKAKLECFANQD